MYKLKEEKNLMRKDILALRRQLDTQSKAEMDERIFELFKSLVSYRYSDTVLAYYSKPTEVSTQKIIADALSKGKRVALPICFEQNSKMEYRYIESLHDLEEGLYGIPAPKADCELFEKQSQSRSVVAVVPALAFDEKGYRLGYGKGYYDRYMCTLDCCKVGLAYSTFVKDSLPVGKFDMRVDLLVSEKGVRLIEKTK